MNEHESRIKADGTGGADGAGGDGHGGIGWAVKQLHNGSYVTRSGWNGRNTYLFFVAGGGEMVAPSGHTYATQPYVVMKTAQDTVVPWLCSQGDLLATDWTIVA